MAWFDELIAITDKGGSSAETTLCVDYVWFVFCAVLVAHIATGEIWDPKDGGMSSVAKGLCQKRAIRAPRASSFPFVITSLTVLYVNYQVHTGPLFAWARSPAWLRGAERRVTELLAFTMPYWEIRNL
jgi:hypothetical protein